MLGKKKMARNEFENGKYINMGKIMRRKGKALQEMCRMGKDWD